MLDTQSLVALIASATAEGVEGSYKSLQELVRIIASCIEIDDDGNPVLRVKSVD